MRGQNVKKTMIYRAANVIAPHYCCSCGEIGEILCESCFYDIVSESAFVGRCLVCTRPSVSEGVCTSCQASLPYSRAWAAAERRDAVQRLIDSGKYESNRTGCDRQAELLSAILPVLPAETVIVPVPTIQAHIRQRGYGHTERLARQLAKIRNIHYAPLLRRRASFVQQGANLSTRIRQAEQSFAANPVTHTAPILLVDDVFTTGSTLKYAAKTLRDAGADDVWVAVTSRQLFDD